MSRATESIAGLQTIVVSIEDLPRVVVVLLHGYGMSPEDLVPFTESLGVPGWFYTIEGPLHAEGLGRAWWPIDQERRARALEAGPRDLHEEHPPGARPARARLTGFLAEVRRRHPGLPIVLVGFSQGGMLALDTVLRERSPISALALLSASRISADEWEPLGSRLAGLPILVCHGTNDPDLAFEAGEALRDFCASRGGDVTWIPFPGGHEIPLIVWRALRKLLLRLQAPQLGRQQY